MPTKWPKIIGGTEFKVAMKLRYGENQRQENAALLIPIRKSNDPFAAHKFELVGGTDPSFVNETDLNRLIETATRIGAVLEKNLGYVPAIALAVKHGNLCGAAIMQDTEELIKDMIDGDFDAISGGVLLTNFEITAKHARLLRSHHSGDGSERILDSVIAPSFDADAINILARKKTGKCRMFVNPHLRTGLGIKSIYSGPRYRQVRGDFLVQDGDPFVLEVPREWQSQLSDNGLYDLMLGWAIGSTSNSNSIVLTKDRRLIAAGLGQRSRVMACKLALMYAEEYLHDPAGSTAYSDSFFPFVDGPQVLADAGISTIFATSGSVRDAEVRAVCKKNKVKLFQLPDVEARGFYGH